MSIACFISSHVFAAKEPFIGRAEVSWRHGSERSILVTEFWVPLAQDPIEGNVLYGDYRMMGDDQDNREFNVGIGYREIVSDVPVLGDGVAGVHGWFDRRHTERGSTFNQVTAGAEWYGEEIDIKLNGYLPLNDHKTYIQVNPNGTNGGFVGNQIVVDTNQLVQEEALKGMDLEIGYNVPFLKDYTDSTRVYGGVYHFAGDRAEDVSGWRTRIASDITSNIELGARFQSDNVRGSQGFLEATIRFPFGNKKGYKKEGLRARLDESPERDIDIVSNEVITDDGNNKTLLSATTGNAQNVIHVNNTAGGGGDGSVESPYNTLAAAEGAASTNDLIYVHRGDGTTAGQADGITLNDTGQMLVGSGTNLSFDNGSFTTSNGQGLLFSTIISADSTGAPTITNGAGDGITITADNVKVSGVTVDGATDDGISITYTTAGDFSVTLSDITSKNNTGDGFDIRTTNGANINASVLNTHRKQYFWNISLFAGQWCRKHTRQR